MKMYYVGSKITISILFFTTGLINNCKQAIRGKKCGGGNGTRQKYVIKINIR